MGYGAYRLDNRQPLIIKILASYIELSWSVLFGFIILFNNNQLPLPVGLFVVST